MQKDLAMCILLFLVYLHLAVIVCISLSTQRIWLRWLLVLYPPVWMVFLFWIPFDIFQIIFWFPAAIAFFLSILSLLFQFWRILYRFKKRMDQIPFCKTRLVRPILTIIIFLMASFSLKLSLIAADQYAVKKAKEIQEIVNMERKCPLFLKEWPHDSIMYGRFGTKYPVTYNLSNDDPNEFIICVRHSIDDRFYVKGGIDRELQVFVILDSDKIKKRLNDY